MVAESSSSRRSLLRAGLAGLAGLALGALGRPPRTRAAAGGPVVMGASNSAGTTNTSLSTASTGTAFQVNQTSTGTALRGVANNGIAGFFTSGLGSGVSGVVGHNAKYGVYGANDAASYGGGAAIRAAGKHNHGLVATTADIGAVAVRAENSAANPGGRAVLALSAGSTGDELIGYEATAIGAVGTHGIAGAARDGSDFGIGVVGMSSGFNGIGVWGMATSTTGQACGVGGVTLSSDPEACGAYGSNSEDTGYGVFGYAESSTGTSMALYGLTESATGYGLYSDGRAHVVGNLTVIGTIYKTSDAFHIDHPLDPANKFLNHSVVESPDMLNVYAGTATLDGAGAATVTMPDWFEALNKETRIQLTAVGQAMPNLHARSKPVGNAFSIGGGEPGGEVFWQVTGVRRDAYAEAHRLVVEEPKPEGERGLYLHPVEHGQPAEKGIGARRSAGARRAARARNAAARRGAPERPA